MCFVWLSEETVPFALYIINPLNSELNPVCHLLALLGAHLIFHVSRIRVNRLGFYNRSEEC
jgi:transposase